MNFSGNIICVRLQLLIVLFTKKKKSGLYLMSIILQCLEIHWHKYTKKFFFSFLFSPFFQCDKDGSSGHSRNVD